MNLKGKILAGTLLIASLGNIAYNIVDYRKNNQELYKLETDFSCFPEITKYPLLSAEHRNSLNDSCLKTLNTPSKRREIVNRRNFLKIKKENVILRAVGVGYIAKFN